MIGGDGADEFLVRAADQNPDNDFVLGTDILTIALPKADQNNAHQVGRGVAPSNVGRAVKVARGQTSRGA